MTFDNLLGGPPPTYFPTTRRSTHSRRVLTPDRSPRTTRRPRWHGPTWPRRALADGDDLTGYAFARVGYHRGLDALRRNGWKGHGPIPWEHEPNQGFLRCLAALARRPANIGETDEAERCATFLADSDPSAPS